MVIDFTSDEEFHQWCEDHQDDGFFVGYASGYPPKIPRASTDIPRMHRASCKVATTRARSNYVGRLYEKSGSTDRRQLVLRFEPAGLQYCDHSRAQNIAALGKAMPRQHKGRARVASAEPESRRYYELCIAGWQRWVQKLERGGLRSVRRN